MKSSYGTTGHREKKSTKAHLQQTFTHSGSGNVRDVSHPPLCGSFPAGTMVKNLNLPANAGDMGLIPGWERYPGVGNGKPLQYSCLENPMDRGALRATVHRVSKSQT